ncbi:3-hydroxyacyl-CoA dehydrogenase family protein [Irregularibacter muris]|uniref:3-hydroxybutyryl-CoA dehydrogenase n=1 Tax=Irregularibacter muris TaxID=1796619 RepID=A0AAE3HH03_9FIRM|nr:3-hydroxyacyl-CoA dehydrogenase family protein [Irregularibacter muris]MCR1899362.1 3-hydroxyacyl-CoA dehydrogenase family protein [Irregularibacter muris]
MKTKADIKNIVIAGAGIMGASFAQIFARYGYHVNLFDISDDAIAKSKELIRMNQKNTIEEGDITKEDSEKLISNISYTLDMEVFKSADFVIEAIAEKLAIKHKFWEQVSKMVSEDTILTTNTSGLSINKIAEVVNIPKRFCGMHWVNPPHIIPLVEIIAGDKTEKSTLEIVKEVALSIHRKPVLVKKDINGFVLNRLQYALIREAFHIVESGAASIEDVDHVMKYGLGMRYACIGPFETIDFGGLDIFFNVGSYMFKELSNSQEVPKLLADLYAQGAYGVKTGKGFYDYSNGQGEKAIEKRDKDFMKVSKCLHRNS